jgi:lipoprotein-anchoring transpeptidase ErfK/SrfK
MLLRALGAITAFVIGFAGVTSPAQAQIYPPGPRYVPPPPPFRQLPPADLDDDLPPFDPPPGYRQPAPPPYAQPPRGNGPIYVAPPPQVRAYPAEPEPYYEPLPPPGGYREPPPGGAYREPPPGYEPIEPRGRTVLPIPSPLDILRPPGGMNSVDRNMDRDVDPGPNNRGTTGSIYSALPPEERPEIGPRKDLPPNLRRTQVEYATREPAGTIIIDTANTYLYLVLGNGKAMRYGIGVGREGFTWAGAERVSRMAEWPDWHPPAEMIERQPYLPRFMAGGDGNPLGARALYLGKTLYRIHGTNQPSTIGTFVSSGCIRLINEDVTDLYQRVQVGTRVVVLAGRPPAATANARPMQEQGMPQQPYNPLAPPPRR